MLELHNLLQKDKSELRLLEGVSERLGHRIGELRKRIQAMEALEATDNPIPNELFTALEKILPSNGNKPFRLLPVGDLGKDQKTYIVLASIYNEGNPGLTSSEIIDSVQASVELENTAIYKVLNRQLHSERLTKDGRKYSLTDDGIRAIKILAKEKTGEDY